MNSKRSIRIQGAAFGPLLISLLVALPLVAQSDPPPFVQQQPAAVTTPAPGEVAATDDLMHAVYRCEHINASSLVTTLQGVFDPSTLKVVLGPTYLSPSLASGGSNSAITGDQGSTINTLGDSDPALRTQEVVLVGDAAVVKQAIALAKKLDHHRAQVRLKLSISDVSVDALRQLGLQWNFSNYSLSENSNATQQTASGSIPVVSGIKFGSFAHSPVSVSATISALESNGKAKLLAEPTLALLDGERSFILIGQKQLFPHLVTSYYGAPSYDIQEVRVGIYIQVAAQIGTDDQVVLTIYPQVSLITDQRVINGGIYPIIETREQQTTIRARSGETVVIGGLIRDDDVRSVERIPLLGRIPIIGELFKFRENLKTRTELIVTLTPEIEPGS